MKDLLTLFDHIEANVDASAETYAAYIDDCRALLEGVQHFDGMNSTHVEEYDHTNNGAWAAAEYVSWAAWNSGWWKANNEGRDRDMVKSCARIAKETMTQRLIHLAWVRFGVAVQR